MVVSHIKETNINSDTVFDGHCICSIGLEDLYKLHVLSILAVWDFRSFSDVYFEEDAVSFFSSTFMACEFQRYNLPRCAYASKVSRISSIQLQWYL